MCESGVRKERIINFIHLRPIVEFFQVNLSRSYFHVVNLFYHSKDVGCLHNFNQLCVKIPS